MGEEYLLGSPLLDGRFVHASRTYGLSKAFATSRSALRLAQLPPETYNVCADQQKGARVGSCGLAVYQLERVGSEVVVRAAVRQVRSKPGRASVGDCCHESR